MVQSRPLPLDNARSEPEPVGVSTAASRQPIR